MGALNYAREGAAHPSWVRRAAHRGVDLHMERVALPGARLRAPRATSRPPCSSPLLEAMGIHELSQMSTSRAEDRALPQYTVLGVLLALTRTGSPWWPRVLVGVATPSADETMRLFMPGRGGRVTDDHARLRGGGGGMALAPQVFDARSVDVAGKDVRGAHAGSLHCRRTCRSFATMVSSVTAMRVRRARDAHRGGSALEAGGANRVVVGGMSVRR